MAASSGAKMSGKRKRKVLTVETKLEILARMAEGVSQCCLAEEYSVGTSTISNLKKNEAKTHGIC